MEVIQGDMDKKNRQIETLQKDLTAQIAENEKKNKNTNKLYAKQSEESYTKYKELYGTKNKIGKIGSDKKKGNLKRGRDEFIRIEAIYKAAPRGIYRGCRDDDRTDRRWGPD